MIHDIVLARLAPRETPRLGFALSPSVAFLAQLLELACSSAGLLQRRAFGHVHKSSVKEGGNEPNTQAAEVSHPRTS